MCYSKSNCTLQIKVWVQGGDEAEQQSRTPPSGNMTSMVLIRTESLKMSVGTQKDRPNGQRVSRLLSTDIWKNFLSVFWLFQNSCFSCNSKFNLGFSFLHGERGGKTEVRQMFKVNKLSCCRFINSGAVYSHVGLQIIVASPWLGSLLLEVPRGNDFWTVTFLRMMYFRETWAVRRQTQRWDWRIFWMNGE